MFEVHELLYRNQSPENLGYMAAATAPHSGHLRTDSSCIQLAIRGFSCVPRSVTWNASSRMITGVACVDSLQYHRNRSNQLW